MAVHLSCRLLDFGSAYLLYFVKLQSIAASVSNMELYFVLTTLDIMCSMSILEEIIFEKHYSEQWIKQNLDPKTINT